MPSWLRVGVFGMQAWVTEFVEVNTALRKMFGTPWVGLNCGATGQAVSLTGRRGCWEMFLNSAFTGPSHGAVISFPQTSVSCFKAGPVSPSPMPSLFSVFRLHSHPPVKMFLDTQSRSCRFRSGISIVKAKCPHLGIYKEWYFLFKNFFFFEIGFYCVAMGSLELTM